LDKMSDRLGHPPFHFDVGQFTAGTLEATAFIGGKSVANHRVDTPDAPQRLTVSLDDSGVSATAGDLIFARASIVDGRFRPVPISGQAIHFEASGDYEIVGDTKSTTEGGEASVLVRVKRASPVGTVRASGAQLDGTLPTTF
ncbi:MAG TPA: hypothetical protein VGB81_01480, partial [Devosia sp.]